MKNKKNTGKRPYRLLIDDSWELADLSEKDVDIIKKDIDGMWQRQYLIKLHSGEIVDTGIIDAIKAS